MNFERKTPTDREYMEMLYSLITEMNSVMTSQFRTMNNSIANSQRIILDLQNLTVSLIDGLRETRDKRYQEEIDHLELQMLTLQKQVEEKKASRDVPTMTTSQEIRAVALDVIKGQREEEKKRWSIDWADVWKKTVPYIVGALALAFVLYALPEIGKLLIDMFSK